MSRYTEEQEERILQGDQQLQLGDIERLESRYPQAQQCYQKALQIYRRVPFEKGIAQCLLSIGIIAQQRSNYPQAMKYFRQSLEYLENKESRLTSSIYRNMGHVLCEQGKIAEAL